MRLLDAAVDVFGEFGYAAATTRMIAAKAKVNIAAIPYYFGGKEGLYSAVVNHISETVHLRIAEALKSCVNITGEDSLSPGEALDRLENLLSKLIAFMVGSPEAQRFVRIVLREQLYPSSAYAIIYNRVMEPLLKALAAMITLAAGCRTQREATLRAMTVMGQVMGFRAGRETLVRLMDLNGYSPDETAEISEVILEQTRAAMQGLFNRRQKRNSIIGRNH